MKDLLKVLLETGPYPQRSAVAYRLIVSVAAVLGTGLRVFDTIPEFELELHVLSHWLELVAVLLLTLDLIAHASDASFNHSEGASQGRSLVHYLKSPTGIIDILAIAPYWVAQVWDFPGDVRTALGLICFLKLARYSPALATLESVIARESRQLRSAVFIMLMLILVASTALYLVERRENPNFSSIPSAMWWAVITLTTLGYGDVIPISTLGKFLAGCTAVLGVGMFALPASILASGFAEEMKRRDFLHTWRMVSRVPFFAELDADQIATIANLLRFMAASQGDVLIRTGEMGDRMFFIISGVVTVQLGDGREKLLGDGDFFGEIALLHKAKRTATIIARSRCELLALDMKDFRQFLQRTPKVAQAIEHTARERLHQSGITFTDADDEKETTSVK